jgi:hypothetical protein
MAKLVLGNHFESNQYDNVLNSANSNKKRLIAHALADAINNIELPFEISRKAYQVKLDGLINGDTYANPKASGRIGNGKWINVIPENRRVEMWGQFEYLFELLDKDAGLYDLENQTLHIFDLLTDEMLNHNHYLTVRQTVTKLLDLYNWIEVMSTLTDYLL